MCPLEYIDPRDAHDLQSIPELVPPTDPVFTYLLEEAVAGRMPVYFAAIPLTLVWPFAVDFDPERHPVGRQMVDAVFAAGCQGHMQRMWVYPRDQHFVASDDYVTLAAARRGDPDFVPCWVLGEPHLPGVEQIQGPIRLEDVRRLLGI